MRLLTNRSILIILLFFSAKISSQVALPDFNIVRGTKSFALGKVGSMAQDKYGYMWFADQTNGSLVRYDGYHVQPYRHDPKDSSSLGPSTFECIAADASGNIWIEVTQGVDKFDFATNKFIHYRYQHGEKSRGNNSLLVDHSGIVWLGTSEGLDRLDPATGKFTHYVHTDNDPSSLSCNIVRSLYEDKTGTLWVGTGAEFDSKSKEGGLNKFNKEAGTFTRYVHDPNNPNSIIGNKVRAIFEDSKGSFWVGTDSSGLHLMNREKGTFERLTYDPKHPEKLSSPAPTKKKDDFHHITFITEDILGKIWIGTYSEGIVCFDPETKKINHFDIEDKKRLKGYTGNSSWACYNSKDGVLWISNEEAELFRVDPLQAGFSQVNLGATVDNFLEDRSGNLWMNTQGKGLMMENIRTGAKKSFLHNPADSLSISSNIGGFIKQRPDGQLWIGTLNGANLFNPQTGRFKRYFYSATANDDYPFPFGIFDVFERKNETLFGASDGLKIKNNNTGAISYYRNDTHDTNSISKGGVVCSLDNGDGNIWMCVWDWENGGLDLFNIAAKKFKHYLHGLIVWRIFKSSEGKIWVCTSKGLFYRNDSLDTFIQIGDKNFEFTKAKIKSITEDANKNLWGVSSQGIFRYDPHKDELYIYGDKFGTFDVGAYGYEPSFSTSSGELLFGNPDGYYKCLPNKVYNAASPQISITDFKINGRSIKSTNETPLKGAIEDTKEITLHYNQNKISIDFAGIHFADPENNSHQYILEGYENEWRDVREEKAAYYFNIPPGHYVFKVKATTSYGVNAEKSIRIIVLPPWWQTWWAYTLYAILLASAVWAFIKWRTKALKKEKDVLETKVADRTKELKKEKELVEKTLSELKATQAQLIQSEKMASLGEMTAGIAHEIQNPLNFVNNFSEVNKELADELQQEIDKGNYSDARVLAGDIKENEEKINHHGKRADAIVKGMLQHSRTSSGLKEPTEINALCEEYLRLAYHGLRAKDKNFNTGIKTELDNSIGKINVIPQDIGRVILNLINNAFYAVDEKKKQLGDGYEPMVSVSTKRNSGKVEIKILDNGNGIPKKILDKIFQPFFTTKPTGQGTGLGLSMSYDIIKAHGGEIKIESKENEGANFTVILPAE